MESYWVAAVLVVTGVFFVALGFRARTANQWRTSLDTYAEREIARQRRRQTLQRTRAFFTLLGPSVVRNSPALSDQIVRDGKV